MKRSATQGETQAEGSPPTPIGSEQTEVAAKREKAHNMTAVCVGPVGSQSELSEKTLRIQNRRLFERLELSQRTADQLRRRAEQLEERKAADDTLLFALSSNWSRLDEELRVLLKRFEQKTDASNGQPRNGAGNDENSNQTTDSTGELPSVDSFSEATESAQTFLGVLSSGDRDEMDQRLEQRVQVTQDTLSRLLTAFDKVIQRQDRLANLVSSKQLTNESSEVVSILAENSRLQQLCTRLQSERHVADSQATKLGDRLSAAEIRLSELQVRSDDLAEALNSANRSIIKLDKELGEWKARAESGALQSEANKAAAEQAASASASSSPSNTADELNEAKELASERLAELQQTHAKLTDAIAQLEKLKQDVNDSQQQSITNTATQIELESARSQLVAIKVELIELRTALDEARIQQTLQAAAKQRLLEQAETNEVSVQRELRDALDASNARLSNALVDVENTRSSFEQLRVAHEQTAGAARDMRALIESLRTYYAQLKHELVRVRQMTQQTASSGSAEGIASPTPSVNSNAANTPVPNCTSGDQCTCKHLLNSAKQREESLVNELTVTSQAYEEMQDQSMKLTETVRQKDEAALKLVEERSDALKIVRLLRDEKDALVEQVELLQAQLDSQQVLCHRLEEKDNQLQVAFQSAEREAAIRAQALEAQRRKASDLALKLHEVSTSIERYQRQSKEAQSLANEKTVMVEKLLYQQRRSKEEVAALNRRLERLKRLEQMSAPVDQVVAEELREYKELLACPICKVRQKDAMLMKCSHLFCMNCLRTRYETRQRKCPKCNAMFGANDFKRVFF